MAAKLRHFLNSLSFRERIVLGVILLCAATAMFCSTSLAARTLAPEWTVCMAAERGTELDPWGQDWRCTKAERHEDPFRPIRIHPMLVYSTGPNGADEKGKGDDIAPRRLLAYGTPPAPHLKFRAAGVVLTFILGWALTVFRTWRAPLSERLGPQFLRAALMASVPALLAWAPLAILARTFAGPTSRFGIPQILPPDVAAGGVSFLLCFLLALWLGLREAPKHPNDTQSTLDQHVAVPALTGEQ